MEAGIDGGAGVFGEEVRGGFEGDGVDAGLDEFFVPGK